jgi:hypothetical protein
MAGPLSEVSRNLISRALAEAEQALAAGHRQIAEQRARIEELKDVGRETAQAERLFRTLVDAHALEDNRRVRLQAAPQRDA